MQRSLSADHPNDLSRKFEQQTSHTMSGSQEEKGVRDGVHLSPSRAGTVLIEVSVGLRWGRGRVEGGGDALRRHICTWTAVKGVHAG